MKKLQSEIENKRYDFDADKIWSEIDIPVYKKRKRWLILLLFPILFIVGLGLFMFITQVTNSKLESKTLSTEVLASQKEDIQNNTQQSNSKVTQDPIIKTFDNITNDISEKEKVVFNSPIFSSEVTVLEMANSEDAPTQDQVQDQDQEQEQVLQSIFNAEEQKTIAEELFEGINLNPENISFSEIHTLKSYAETLNPFVLDLNSRLTEPVLKETQLDKRNRLAFLSGLGSHTNSFKDFGLVSSSARTEWESENLDLHIQLMYSRYFSKRYFIFTNLSISRFHDNINRVASTQEFKLSPTNQLSGRVITRSYDINNYYSSIALSAGLGVDLFNTDKNLVCLGLGAGSQILANRDVSSFDQDDQFLELNDEYNMDRSLFWLTQLNWTYTINSSIGIQFSAEYQLNRSLGKDIHGINVFSLSIGLMKSF